MTDITKKQPKKIGLARVSTEDQNCDLQINALKAFGCDKVFTEDGVSGGIHPHEREEFQNAMACLEKGGIFVVWKMDRLGRSLKNIIEVIDDLHDSDVQFVSLTENVDTTTATGRAFWQFIGLMAELERELIRERTKEGLLAARKRGQRLGRPFRLNDKQILQAFRKMTSQCIHLNDLAYDLNVSRQTLKRGFLRLGLVG